MPSPWRTSRVPRTSSATVAWRTDGGRFHAGVRGEPGRRLRARRDAHDRRVCRLLGAAHLSPERGRGRADRRGRGDARRPGAERGPDRAVPRAQPDHGVHRHPGRLAHRAERAHDDVRRGQRHLLLPPGRPAPRRPVPLDDDRHRGDLLRARPGRADLPAAAAHAPGQVDQGRVAGPRPRPGERHPGATGGAADLVPGRGGVRLRRLHARGHGWHVRPHARVQLPAADHHRRGRGRDRAAVPDPGRRAAGGPGHPDRRRLHQLVLRARVRVTAAGGAHAAAAERAVRPQRGGGCCLMYWISVFTQAGIFAILALGLDIVWGWTGDFDLAFYGYLALGSYMTMVLTIGRPTPPVEYIIGWRLPFPLALVLADVVPVALAAVILTSAPP